MVLEPGDPNISLPGPLACVHSYIGCVLWFLKLLTKICRKNVTSYASTRCSVNPWWANMEKCNFICLNEMQYEPMVSKHVCGSHQSVKYHPNAITFITTPPHLGSLRCRSLHTFGDCTRRHNTWQQQKIPIQFPYNIIYIRVALLKGFWTRKCPPL